MDTFPALEAFVVDDYHMAPESDNYRILELRATDNSGEKDGATNSEAGAPAD
jgi:hypothetical protein